MQRFPLLVALAGLALTSSVLIIIAVGSQVSHGPVYTVAQVQAGLADRPRAWVGRTVLVRGIAQLFVSHTKRPGCELSPLCFVVQATWRLDDPRKPGLVGLPLQWGAANPRRALLRHIPLVGLVVPRQQVAEPDLAATYQIQLRTAPPDSGATPPCYEAVLLDATR
jgi:hypothetical protein